jgi:hypothetical protein
MLRQLREELLLVATALGYINKIRARANAQAITTSGLTLDFILDERGIVWECHRRTDLICFGKFTGGSKTWQWKGALSMVVLLHFRDLMPIPARNIQANPTLKQNPGY